MRSSPRWRKCLPTVPRTPRILPRCLGCRSGPRHPGEPPAYDDPLLGHFEGADEVAFRELVVGHEHVDGLVGARFWNFDLDLKVIEGSTETDAASGDQQWLDGTLGARVRYSSDRHWHLFFRGDAGAGGSDFTWQVLGGAGLDVGSCCIALATYRHLDVDYQSDDFISDIYLTGPALGLEIKF